MFPIRDSVVVIDIVVVIDGCRFARCEIVLSGFIGQVARWLATWLSCDKF